MIDIEDVKNYMKIDYDTDNALIASLIKTAVSYLDGAGVVPDCDDERYKLAVMSMTLNLYENRPIIPDKNSFTNNLIIQLKAEGDGIL